MPIAVVSATSVNFIGFYGPSNEAVRQEILHLTKFSVALESVTPVGSGLGRRLGALPCITWVRRRQSVGVRVKSWRMGSLFETRRV